VRALALWRVLRLYLDPFALFRSIALGPPAARVDAMRYNRRVRRILLIYVRRWTMIGLACLAVIARLTALALGHPLLWIPLAALEIGFTGALCMSFLAIAAYFVLGLED